MFLPGERNQRQRLRRSEPTVDIDNTCVKLVRQLDGAHDTAQMMMVTTMMMTDDNKINEMVGLMLTT